MRLTPHILVAAAVVVLAALCALPHLAGIGAGWPAPVREFRLPAKSAGQVAADRATQPVVAGLDNIVRDPFTLRSGGGVAGAGDLVPPPPLALPALPALPIAER